MAQATPQYPRPDFQRSPLSWRSLNGPWSFLFDDDDVGLSQLYQHHGLPSANPAAATSEPAAVDPDDDAYAAPDDNIAHRIAAGTSDFLASNALVRRSGGGAAAGGRTQIEVPYVFQSPASGVNDRGVHEVLWYERQVEDPRTAEESKGSKRVLLRFGSVDYEARVWLDGMLVGGHRGGHVPFDVDVTDALDLGSHLPSHRLTLRVYDSAYDLTQPRGKQYWGAEPESIFYTPSGGIWQSVWLEVVPAVRIADSSHGTVIRSDDIAGGKLRCSVMVLGRPAGKKFAVEVEASLAGVAVARASRELAKENHHVAVDLDMRLDEAALSRLPPEFLGKTPLDDPSCWLDGVALWSPEHPTLYDLTIRLLPPSPSSSSSSAAVDQVHTTTGMRSLDWTRSDGLFYLNSRPYFQALCLDQGYWPGTFMTPPSPDALRTDIELAKSMGLNGCRKHQKVEDPLFYYWADRLGFLVWGEMANAYEFGDEYVERFGEEWREAVRLVVNHPCVVAWTPVNESWGYADLKGNPRHRNHVRQLYYLTKSLDPSRPVNDNCGWEHVVTDLTTFHDYSDGPALARTCADMDAILGPKAQRDLFCAPLGDDDPGGRHRPGAPVMCTEFGGVNIAPGRGGEAGKDWGYTTASDAEDLLRRLEALVGAVVGGGICCAFVYTQLTDIEQEVNGLCTFDRKPKLEAGRVKKLIDDAVQGFYERVRK